MLMTKLREGAGGWVTKIFLGLLIVAFGIWGIADVFRGFGAQDVATIGSTKIGTEDFRRIYTERLQTLSRQFGRGISPDQARALGLDRQILGELLAENAFDEKSRQLGLAIDDATIARRIQADPNFRGPAGSFDPAYFQGVLRQNGYTEARYVAAERKLLLRQQIARALGGEVAAPTVLREAVRRYEIEERNAEFVTLAPRDAGEIPAPTPEQIAKFFEERKATFRAPEFRKLALLALSPETLLPWIQISEADLKKAYEDRKERISTPEKREVEQIVFPNAEEAKAVAERLRAGAKFEAIILERKLDKKDVSLGLVTKRELLDAAVAEAAFALAAGATSAPVAGRFGPVIVRVVKIEPGREPPLSEVEPVLRRELATEQARRQMLDLHDKIEDDRASGATLAETARKVGLTLTTIEAVDRSGRDPEGALLQNLPARDQLLTGAFAARVGVESDAIEMRVQGQPLGYVWYDVLEIAPSRDRTLEEAKSRVEARWKEEEIGKKLSARAEEIRGKLDAGATFAVAAPGLPLQTRTKLTRGKPAEGLDTRVIARIFDTPQGKAAVAVPDDGVGRVVFRVTAIAMPADPAAAALQTEQLLKGIEDDLVTQYLFRLQNELGASINEAALPGWSAANGTDGDRPGAAGLRRSLFRWRAAARLDHAGGRPGDAGLGVPQARRRQAQRLPVRVGRGRRRARALFDHRARARSGVAHQRRQGRDQSHGAFETRRLRALPRAAVAGAARADRREPHRNPRFAAADGGRRVRLSRLRHGAADGKAAGAEARPHRHSRRGAGAPDDRGDFRRGAGHDHHRHARAPRSFGERQGRATPARPSA